MRYLSLFSGIEAFTVAVGPLGWECAAVAEIEPFPCKVLKHHYPDTPNLGDITKITRAQIEALGHIDVIVFGSPCQDLSSAGKRKGMFNDDGSPTRSGLFFAALRIAEWSNARFAIYENVPGMYSSSKGADFAAVVGEMAGCQFDTHKGGWQNSGVALGQHGLVEWITLDAQFVRTYEYARAVPQRRRRVFVVRDIGDWQSRGPLFLEPDGLRGNPPPSRKTREEVAGTIGARTGLSIGAQDAACGRMITVDTHRMVATHNRQSNCEYGDADIASTMSARDYKSPSDLVTYVMSTGQAGAEIGIGATLNCNHEAMGEGTGMGIGDDGSAAYTLQAAHSHAVAFSAGNSSGSRSIGYSEELSPPLRASTSGTNMTPTIAYRTNAAGQVMNQGEVSATINTFADPTAQFLHHQMKVRRLTPLECERLQGFPDNWTNIPGASDTTRYKALGNSMAVNVMRLIAIRIDTAVTLA